LRPGSTLPPPLARLTKIQFFCQSGIYGIICLTALFLLTQLTHLKRDCRINSGKIKILFMTSEHSCREPEVGVKCCMSNFSKSVIVIVKWLHDAGIEALGLRSLTLSTSTSTSRLCYTSIMCFQGFNKRLKHTYRWLSLRPVTRR